MLKLQCTKAGFIYSGLGGSWFYWEMDIRSPQALGDQLVGSYTKKHKKHRREREDKDDKPQLKLILKVSLWTIVT